MLVGILAGSLVDRIGYKRSSIISDLLSFISVLLIPVLHETIGLEFWQLLVLVFLGACFDTPGISARQALLPELAGIADVSHERANTAYALIRRIAGLIGPPAAGLLLAAIGASNLLVLDAMTIAVSAAIVALTVPNLRIDQQEHSPAGLGGYLRDIAAGFRFLAGNTLLKWIIVTGAIGSLVAEPLYTVILPVYANEVLSSAAKLGFMFAALGAGSIVGNFLYIAIESRVPRRVIQIGGFGLRAVAFSVMLFLPPWWVIAIAISVGAVALEPVNPMSMSILQEQVPSGMRARIYGVGSAIYVVTMPVGMVVYGYLISGLGIDRTLEIFVALNLALPLIMASVPTLRHIPKIAVNAGEPVSGA